MAFSLSSAGTAPATARLAAPRRAPHRAPGGARRAPPRALGNFFGGGGGGSSQQICIDCGYIYRGDWSEVPRSYKCPECGVGVRRFKPLTAQMKAVMQARGQQKKSRGDAGGWYNREADNNMSGAQRAIADAQRRKDKKGKGKAREELLAKYMNSEKNIDKKKKGSWF